MIQGTGRPRRRALAFSLAIAGLVILYVLLQVVRDDRYAEYRAETTALYIPTGAVLQRVALSFDTLLADVYWIRAIQHYGARSCRRKRGSTISSTRCSTSRLASIRDSTSPIALVPFSWRKRTRMDRDAPTRPSIYSRRASTTCRRGGNIDRISGSSITGGCTTTSRRRNGFAAPARCRDRPGG